MGGDVELFKAFFQNNSDKYIDRLTDHRNGRKISFNLFPFLFGLFWFAYRRMYGAAFILFVIMIAENVLANFVIPNDLESATIQGISIITTLVFAAILGFLANYLYLNKAERMVKEARENYSNHEDQKAFLTAKGGTKLLSPIIVVLLLILLALINSMLAVA